MEYVIWYKFCRTKSHMADLQLQTRRARSGERDLGFSRWRPWWLVIWDDFVLACFNGATFFFRDVLGSWTRFVRL